jgi:hypothetical protein
MEILAKKFIDSIIESERGLISAEHVLKVIMPVVKDNKLLLRSLETAHKSSVNTITNILKYEYIHGNVELNRDPKLNQEMFFSKCALKYGLSIDEVNKLKILLMIGKKHKESGFEFSRKNKAVIMDDDLNVSEITRFELEGYIKIVRKLLLNSRAIFSRKSNV